MSQTDKLTISEEVILTKIFLIRGQKVMIDRDLAELYGVETRTLNQAVRRNLRRFPEDFMFQLTVQEFENWKSQIVISNSERMSMRKAPLVFTEQGIAMLSSVLNSDQAISVNIQIIRIFTTMRTMLSSQKDLILALERIQNKQVDHEEKISLILRYIRKIQESKQAEIDFSERPRIGFKK
ncbi:ORF6N domain-containing protein [Algoriphagus sp.]|uniref:ORF6N domain-containing protein n=1 Tax=Algoriphagus sp. TaxID=1872435 RepID=UPI0025FF78F6|nr:ORF6N domain-containing protein [Algoriphagus sp.]